MKTARTIALFATCLAVLIPGAAYAQGVMDTSEPLGPVTTGDPHGAVPYWVKDTARLWAAGEISDREFLNAIEHLVKNKIIETGDVRGFAGSTITIGLIPVEKADELTPEAERLVEFLEERMPGTTVEIEIPTSYEAIIEGMRFGHIDAAFMDTGPGWITHVRTGAEAVLAEVVDGKISYQATVWARADDDSVQTLTDALDRRVAFTSITGSSGFVRPVGTLVTEGHMEIDGQDIIALERALADSFDRHTFAGGYKAALELLINGNVDVAFGSDVAASKYLEPEDQAKVRAVQSIGPVPSHVFMVGTHVPYEQRHDLVDALVQLNYGENNQILVDLYGAQALLPTTTEMHIGDFGDYISALTGLDQLILDKYDKSK